MMDENKSSKQQFWLGLTSGVAVISLIGFVAMLGLYLTKDTTGGADVAGEQIAVANNNNNDNQPGNPEPTKQTLTLPVMTISAATKMRKLRL